MSLKSMDYEPVCEKKNNLGSDQVRHKRAVQSQKMVLKLEILDLESRGIVISM